MTFVFLMFSRCLGSQRFEELQSHSSLMTPTPKSHSHRPDLGGPPFRPDFDLNLTQFWPLGAIWDQNRVKFRSKSCHKGGPNRVAVSGILGWGSSGRSGSVAPSTSCKSRITMARSTSPKLSRKPLWVSWIQKGFKALFCTKTKIPFGRLFWAIRFGIRGPAPPYLRFLACNSDFCPVTLIFGLKSESFC